jgi:hypothetical protein
MSETTPENDVYAKLKLAQQEERKFKQFAALRLADRDVVCVPKALIDICGGDFPAAAILDELLFWTLPRESGRTGLRVRKDGLLWCVIGRDEWHKRKRLSPKQADSGIAKLESLGLIEKRLYRYNGHAKTHLRMQGDQFFKAYSKALFALYLSGEARMDEGELEELQILTEMSDLLDFPKGDSDSPKGNTIVFPKGETINNPINPIHPLNSSYAAIEPATKTSDSESLANDTELWDFSSEKQKSADSTPGTDSTQEREKSVELAPPNAPPSHSSERNSSADAPLSAGQRVFLEAFGAKRFKTRIQRETVAELELRFGAAKLKEYVTWAAKLGMSLGKAVVGAEKALAKWGRNSSSEKPVVSTKGASTASGTVVPDGDGYYVG